MKKILLTISIVIIHQILIGQNYHIVKDLAAYPNNGVAGSTRICLKEFNSKIYFIGSYNFNSSTLFQTDGTELGTTPVIPSLSGSGIPLTATGELFLTANNKLFFMSSSSYNGTNYGTELWLTDGTEAGTKMVKDINPNTANGVTHLIESTGTKIYFSANDGNGEQLWVSDGTDAGTIKLTNFAFFPTYWGDGIGATVVGEKLYLHSGGTGALVNWVTDGTTAGTYTLGTYQKQSYGVHNFVEHNGFVYYFASGTTNNNIEFFKTDGTPTGKSLVKDIITGTTGCYPQALFKFNNKLYFIADKTNANYPGLYESDGTDAGTLFIDTLKNRTISGVHSHAILNNELYIFGSSDATGNEVFKLVNNELIPLKDIYTGTNDGISNGYFDGLENGALHTYNNKLYFSANDGLDGYEQLWSSDGTTNGTTKVTIPGSSAIESAKNMLSSSLGFFFVFRTSAVATELFMLNETATGLKKIFSSDDQFSIYPNPLKGMLNVDLTKYENESISLSITNTLGEIVISKKINQHSNQINCSQLTSGIYLVTIEKNETKYSKKLIVE